MEDLVSDIFLKLNYSIEQGVFGNEEITTSV